MEKIQLKGYLGRRKISEKRILGAVDIYPNEPGRSS